MRLNNHSAVVVGARRGWRTFFGSHHERSLFSPCGSGLLHIVVAPSSRPRRVRASPSLSSRRQPWGVSNAIGRLVFAVAARPPVTVPAADVGDDDGDDGDDDGGDDAQRDRPSSASPPASPAAGSLVAAQTSWTAGGDVGDVPEFPGGLPGKPPTRKILSNRFPLFGSSQQQLPAYQNPTQTTPMGLFVRVFRRSSFTFTFTLSRVPHHAPSLTLTNYRGSCSARPTRRSRPRRSS